jgi:uncharacterized protein
MKRWFAKLSICVVLACLRVSAHAQPAPIGDHHQHLFSPAIALLLSPPGQPPANPITAEDLIPLLDLAGIKRAAVLSTAYIFSQPSRRVENDYEKVRADNDWTSYQVARYPDRLIGFCSLSPVKEYALEELERCAKDPQLRRGLKLHFGNSVVDYHNPAHIDQVRRVFRAANDHGMAIIVHIRPSLTQRAQYGREEALIFLNEILPAAPDVPVQIAHLAGAGGYSDPRVDQALEVFIDAISKSDPRTERLWFDVSAVALPTTNRAQARLIAARIRQLGVQRILYGSDAPVENNFPHQGWAAFLRLPLSDTERQVIADNVPPYMQ